MGEETNERKKEEVNETKKTEITSVIPTDKLLFRDFKRVIRKVCILRVCFVFFLACGKFDCT